jgi:riboflavin-specific deaminase-like protein
VPGIATASADPVPAVAPAGSSAAGYRERVRQLLPLAGALGEADVAAAYDWPRPAWLRACMVMGLDGAIAGPDGRSRSISSPADRAVLAATRARADAVLVGAGTVRAEDYAAMRARPELATAREQAGQRLAPVLAVVSGSARFDWSTARFTASDERVLLLTTQAADTADRQAAAAAGCEVLVVGGDVVDPVRAVAALHDRALTRITCEGGPGLLRQVLAAGLVDELDLTLAPTVGGSGPAVPGLDALSPMRLAHVLEEDGWLFTRYLRPEGES